MKSEVRYKNPSLWLISCGFWLLTSVDELSSSWAAAVKYQDRSALPTLQFELFKHSPTISSQSEMVLARDVSTKFLCSNQNLETITTPLLRDLPSYANRVRQRARRLSRANEGFSYIVVAGRPEFKPLPINPSGYTTNTVKTTSEGVEQVFFTTLERQYVDGKAVQLQEFHWLFLTKAEDGWRFVMMFSQIGSYPKNQPPTPPRESSNGVIAQGISNWLRDCRADSVAI